LKCCRDGHVLAGPGEGTLLRPLAVYSGGDDLGLSLGFAEVDCCSLLHFESGLVLL
jgi:hypothetical protein